MSRRSKWIVSSGALTSLVGLMVPAIGHSEDAGKKNELEEVVVTAQFRAQRLQDTPIAISAISADTLASRSAGDIAAAANAAPNVNISKGALGFGQTAAVFIRGIGQSDPHFAVEPGVGMYIDDVYYGVMTVRWPARTPSAVRSSCSQSGPGRNRTPMPRRRSADAT